MATTIESINAEYKYWRFKIPYLTFPSDWQIKITPPYTGAMVRFTVKKGDANVSVFLDCYDRLDDYGKPYWSVYPHEADEFKCDMEDTDTLLKAISESIKFQSDNFQNEKQIRASYEALKRIAKFTIF